jgi:hypothetical protein
MPEPREGCETKPREVFARQDAKGHSLWSQLPSVHVVTAFETKDPLAD